MNGILCVDKPQGFTSFDVVAKLRGMARTRKVGHGGTLDPMATGVLPLFFGGATKACDLVPVQDKRYTATFQLGLTTDTLDITGEVLAQRPVEATQMQVEQALRGFVGESDQLPPMYSAVQVNGVRLYDLARRGVEVERKARRIHIFHLELLEADEAAGRYTVDIHCSKGTYIRSLCHDVGELLGCGATLAALRRTLSCGFSLEQCVTLEQAQQLTDAGRLEERVLPVEAVFAALPRLALDAHRARLLQNGVRISVEGDAVASLHSAYGPDGLFLGLVEPNEEKWKVKRLFLREALP